MDERQKWIAQWWKQNALHAQHVPMALRLAGIPPSRQDWRLWIERLLLWLGVAALLAGLIFFVAANWSGMGRFGKFALVELTLIASLAAYVWGSHLRYGNAALLAASLAVGALLALIGQTYQTGANTYELFLAWALLILPWVLAARLPALWVLWLAILHVAYVFHMQVFDALWGFSPKFEGSTAVVILFDACALAAWEYLAGNGRPWMRGRWTPRLLALATGGTATALAVSLFLDSRDANEIYFLLYPLVLTGIYGVYRYRIPDPFMLAGSALSLIVVANTGLGRLLLDRPHGNETAAFFLLVLFSMLATAGAAWWLRQVAREQAETHEEDLP
ncbi:MAG: DUF2157 domain-containing protein [Betaproteobacteria bacterium]|nr:DUF2157 domain-containing protein [Betaproteobacteria bacterium]